MDHAAAFLLSMRVRLLRGALVLAFVCGHGERTRAQQAGTGAGAGTRSFVFDVRTKDGEPVVGARVTPVAVSSRGTIEVDANWFPEFRSQADGQVRIVFPSDERLGDPAIAAKAKLLREGLRRGLQSFYLRVEHRDHPEWLNFVKEGETIELVPSAAVVVRVQRTDDGEALHRLYPLLSGWSWTVPEWSEADGALTVRRVDLVSDRATRWLRVLHVPEQGPVLFSDLIDLQEKPNRPVMVDVTLKPGVRFTGRLSGDVPRPVKGGRVIAQIVAGGRSPTPWNWSAAAPIDADGRFVLDALPPNEHLQLIALCEGWLSSSPSMDELKAHAEETGFRMPDRIVSGGFVQAQLHWIGEQAAVRHVPMERTNECLITVLDMQGRPVEGARVSFWPNHAWYHGGGGILGDGGNTLSLVHEALSGRRKARPLWSWTEDFPCQGISDTSGRARITGLPTFGRPSAEHMFSVSHDAHGKPAGKTIDGYPTVKIDNGQPGQATVRLEAKSGEAQ